MPRRCVCTLDQLADSRPIILRSQDRHDLEINQVGPATDPCFEHTRVSCFHNLETSNAGRVNPACVEGDSLRQHAAFTNEPFSNGLRIAILEMFDNHEEHGREYSRSTLRHPNRVQFVSGEV
jgi:hypothetical protein